MRLFIAINLSEEMKNALYGHGVRGRYTTEENLHLTLAFIGEYPDAEPVLDAMSDVTFELTLDGMARFVETISLMRSDRGRNGTIYTELGTLEAERQSVQQQQRSDVHIGHRSVFHDS